MPFNAEDRTLLLAVKGVGPTVILRLEQSGILTLPDLAMRNADDLSREIAAALGATCWRNSPMAKAALSNAIYAAKSAVSTGVKKKLR